MPILRHKSKIANHLFALSPVIVLMTALVPGAPTAEGNHQRPEGRISCPEPVLDAGMDEKLVMGLRMVDLTVQFQMRAVIEEMEQFISNFVRMQAGALPRTDKGQIDRAPLVANHHVDIAPGSLRLDCLFSVPRVH